MEKPSKKLIWKRINVYGWDREKAENTPPIPQSVSTKRASKASPWRNFVINRKRGHYSE